MPLAFVVQLVAFKRPCVEILFTLLPRPAPLLHTKSKAVKGPMTDRSQESDFCGPHPVPRSLGSEPSRKRTREVKVANECTASSKRASPKRAKCPPRKSAVILGGAARNAAARAAALHALRGVEREVAARNAARFPMVSVTLQPFAFMLRDGEQVVALPEGHRGVAWVRDARGRHHQQLRELTFEVRKARVTMPPGLYRNHEHEGVTDAPPIDWQRPLQQLP